MPDDTLHHEGRRNLFAVTAASFMGYTGFTLVMPFLPLFIAQLGVTDVGEVASGPPQLGHDPWAHCVVVALWGRLADRFGRTIMVERSLASFVVFMDATAFVTRAWHVLALRAAQGLFAGYGSVVLAWASARRWPRRTRPRDR